MKNFGAEKATALLGRAKIGMKMGTKNLNNDLLYKFWKRLTKLYLYFYIDNIFMKCAFKAIMYHFFSTEK